MGFVQELKIFINRGNVVDLAVGIIIGGAFGKVVSSAVNDLIMPPIGILLGGVDFKALKLTLKQATIAPDGKTIEAVTINYGMFIQTVVDFLLIALAVFLIVKAVNKIYKKQAAISEPPAEVTLLTEIRDLLKKP